jgi:hypothetical protein
MLSIALIMIIPLVLWNVGGKSGSGQDVDDTVGTIFETVKISKREFNDQKLRAHPAYYWRMVKIYPRMAGRIPEPKNEDVLQIAKRNLVLLQEAKNNGIPKATKSEMQRKLQDIWFMFTGGRVPMTEQNEEMLAKTVFRATLSTFEAWIEDLVVIEKLLGLMSGAEFADYDKIYDRLMGEQQSVRVTFAGFDPAEFVRELKPPRTEEIAKQYEANKSRYRTPEKARIEYLMADVDEIKKKAPEPTEAQLKQYYEEHKIEFQKTIEHKHGPGEEHKDEEKPAPPEYKSLSEVQAEIPEKWKRKWAEENAFPVIDGASKELGDIFVANQSKYPDNIFGELKNKYSGQKGIELTHDVTPLFDSRRLEEIEKIVGSNSGLGSWAFDPKNKAGDISMSVQTSKGKVLFKLLDKKAGEENPGVTLQNRELIVKELQKEQLRKRVQLQASTVVDEIKAHGMAATRLKYPVEWRSTRYFKTDFNGDPGIEDRALGGAIRSRVAQGKMKAGEAMVLQGSTMGREKQDWSYVLYVDDVVSSPPDDLEAKFQETRREMDGAVREQYQENYANQMVFRANIRGLESKDGGKAEPPPVPHDDDN